VSPSRLAVLAAVLFGAAGVAGCGGGDDGQASEPEPAAQAVGKEIAGSVVQYADCGDWREGSRAERVATVEQLRGQLTPQRSKSAASPLPDERAYEMLDKACTPEFSESLRLYKLYARMQGFAPLSE
jgi:hypothetical protein